MTGNSYMNEGNRPFYFHFKCEHQRIDDAVHDVQRNVHRAPNQTLPTEITEHLTRLRDMMAQHFLEEEEGCLDEIVTQSPYLSAEAKQMEREHRRLLKELDDLIQEASRRTKSTNWKTRFDQFEQSLRQHEQLECALVRRGLQLSDEDA